jgi:hypothetical protein
MFTHTVKYKSYANEELLVQLCFTNVAFSLLSFFLSLTHIRCTVLLCVVLSDPAELNVCVFFHSPECKNSGCTSRFSAAF